MAEQKICELKKLLLRSKQIEKFKVKHIKPNKLVKKATFNLNNTRSVKYGYSPEQIEEQVLDPKTGKYFQEIYDFYRLIKVKENRDWTERFDAKVDRCKKRLRDPIEIGEKVLVFSSFVLKKHLEWFILDFSNTELIYQINFSTQNDYYITTMNCNLVIAKDYGGLLDNIKKLLAKSRLLLEKGAAYQLDLS